MADIILYNVQEDANHPIFINEVGQDGKPNMTKKIFVRGLMTTQSGSAPHGQQWGDTYLTAFNCLMLDAMTQVLMGQNPNFAPSSETPNFGYGRALVGGTAV